MKNNKLTYEEVALEIVPLAENDVVATSVFETKEHSFEW